MDIVIFNLVEIIQSSFELVTLHNDLVYTIHREKKMYS